MWYTEGAKNAPSSGTILADTGALSGGIKTIAIVADTNVSGIVIMEHRNAANDTTINSQRVTLTLNSPFTYEIPYSTLTLAEDERIRVITSGLFTLGVVQASIFSS